MKKLLLMLSAVILSLGMLGAAACSGCSEDDEETTKSSVQSNSCGPNTHRVGNACEADSKSKDGDGTSDTLDTADDK
ncbi:MAG: hypothetical protein AAB268_01940 [Elusimicrobiota bacterium]